MPQATLSTKGQVVVPREVRALLRLRPGDKLDFVVREDGQVLIRPAVMDVRELRGALQEPNRPAVSLEAMRDAVRARAGR